MARILHVVPGTDDVANGMVVVARLLAKEQGDADVVDLKNADSGKIAAADEVWVHGTWLPKEWAMCREALRTGKRLVRMTHGSLSPIYLTQQSPLKKKLISPIERYFLRKSDKVIATCEAEKGWIESYLGRRCPPIALTDIKRFFDFSRVEHVERVESDGEVLTRNRPLRVDATPGESAKPSESSAERREDAEFSLGRCPRPPSAEGSPISLSAHSAPLRLCVKNNEQAEPLHLLYLGRRHPLKGLSYLEAALTTYYNMWSKSSASPTPTNACTAHPSGNPSIKPSNTTYYNKCPIDFRVVSSAFGDELEKVWDWCDVLVLPTLSENFGLVIAEALERGKSVITTDGAPAWECECKVEKCKVGSAGAIWQGYDGRLIYLKGYRTGTPEDRIRLLQSAIENLLCPASLTPPASHASLTSPAVK